MLSAACIAYFSMEIGLESRMPTYAGGLGILAGDTIRSAADAGLPMVAVSREHIESVRPLCVFTTHTPVPAGHD